MKDKKTIKISTNFFELNIFWNGTYISSQLAVVIGLLAVKLFARNSYVSKLCTIVLLADLIVVLFLLLQGASVTTEDRSEKTEGKPDSNLDIKVEHNKGSDKHEGSSKQKSSSSVIKNKVPIPTSNSTSSTSIPPVPVPVPVVPVPATPTTSHTGNSKDPELINRNNVRELKDMTEDDWKDLFEMKGDL